MNFPEWAPPQLIEYYQSFYSEQDPNWHRTLCREALIAITTNPEMKIVWKMLFRKRKRNILDEKNRGAIDNAIAVSLFFAIDSALVETKRKVKTRGEDVLKYQEIAKAARELAEKVSRSSLDKSPFHWFHEDAINLMLEKDINPDKASGYFCLIHDESDYFKKGGIYQEVKAKDSNGNDYVMHWRHGENTRDFFNRFLITPKYYPALSDILKSMAADADTQAKHESKRPRIASKETTSKTTIFIRALYPFWLETFGGTLSRTFAALCRVVLNDCEIDENSVKDALRGYGIPDWTDQK